MSTENNKGVVRKFFRLLTEANLSEASQLYTDDCQYWISGSGEMDAQTVQSFWPAMFSAPMDPGSIRILNLTAEDDRVAAELQMNLKLPDGRDYSNRCNLLFVFHDGKIVKVSEYMDTAYVQKIFGPQPQ